MTDIILFSEDALIEQAALKIILEKNPNIRVSNLMGRRGFSYFESRLDSIRRSSTALKFLVFLDGDELGAICPATAITNWFQVAKPANIDVRFAFHEVESWLLADRENLARFLSISPAAVPAVDDMTQNTKELLVNLARRSRNREVVQDMVPPSGYSARVGPAYNARVAQFIEQHWNIDTAANHNQSLARACRRVSEIA